MIRRLRDAVCWQHIPHVLTWRVRRVGPAGVVVRGRRGGYTGYSPTLRYAVMGGDSAGEVYAGLRGRRAWKRRPESIRLTKELAQRYRDTRRG